MGAACCGDNKKHKRYVKEPIIPPKGSEEEARLKAAQKDPALDSHGNPLEPVTNLSQNNPNAPPGPGKESHESPEKLITEEDREPKYENMTGAENASQDTFIRFPTKAKTGSQALDQTMKSQGRGITMDGKDKNRSIVGNGAGHPLGNNNPSMGNVDQVVYPGTNENLYEINFEEKGIEPEDYYLELNETQVKDYEKFVATSMHGKQKSVRSLNTLGGNKLHSQLLEWSKLLQKVCIQENPPNSPAENDNKLLKAYEAILKLDERNWYEEMVMLYKEKNFMSKNTGNMTGLTFDRKIIQLQEQFKWLISAVANIKLNYNNLVGVYEFPTFRLPNRLRKSDKLDSSNASMIERQNSVVEGHLESEMFASPKHPFQGTNRRPSVMKTQMGSIFAFRGSSFEPRNNFYQDLPEVVSAAWQEGFIWKGVFLKLYSLKEGEKLKREIRALKHLGVEYLQTEAASRVVETFAHSTNNISEILESGKPVTAQIINILLPLVCTIESSTWILLGTPVFPIKKSVAEDQALRVFSDSAAAFKNSFLLSGLTPKNFKMYYKAEENPQQQAGSTQSYSNTASAGPHSSYLQGNSAVSHNNVFLLLTNVSKTLVPLPKVNIMFIMNQEPNAHVTFLEFPKRKALDMHLIKQALGYSGKELDMTVLINPRKPRAEIRNESKGLYLDMVTFRRRGWVMQLIYVDSKDPLPYSFSRNKRACDLLSHSRTKGRKEIRGNVLVFASHSNHNSIIHPYFISEQFLLSGDDGPGGWDPLDTPKVNRYGDKKETGSVRKPSNTQTKAPKPGNGEPESFVRDSFLKQSFKQGYSLRDEKALADYFASNVSKSIDYVVDYLDKTDNIVNFAGIKELFHRKGLNMRFAWIVFMKLQRQRVKAMVGADILARCVKKAIQDKTSTKLKHFAKQMRAQAFTQKDKIEELTNERNEFFMENFAKNLLSQYLNVLIRNSSEALASVQLPKGVQQTRPEEVEDEAFFDDMSTELFLNKTRVMEYAKKMMNAQDFDFFLSAEIIRTIMNISCLHANVFLNAISYHMKVSVNYEVLRQFRNDKYNCWVAKTGLQIKPVDFNFIYHTDSYLTIPERCYILLLKILPSFQSVSQTTNELVLPAALYKLRRGPHQNDGGNTFGFDCFLRDSYELPDLEVLNDWIVLLESALNGLYTLDGQQNFLTEAYMLQLILAYFGEGDYDNQLTLSILERVSAFLLNSPVSSPELCITIYTWFGILLENKLIAECEQNYLRALLILHKLYGDPRGRGGLGTPWELFITWRLSILSRLQGKTHDAEYCEELFDATLVTLKDNPLNTYTKSHYIYTDPLKAFYSTYTKGQPTDELYHLSRMPELQKMEIKDHPFSYWTAHLAYTEANSKVDVINQTLQKTPQLLKWMVTHMPTFQHTGVLWNSANLRDFYLYILQSSFNNAMSMSSISSYSIDKSRDRSIITGLNGSFTPKSRTGKVDKKEKGFEQAGNLVQMVEKDTSTFNKKEINGMIYAWGQNNDGQVGTPAGLVEDSSVPTHKKMRIYYPKGLLTLKDTIIVSVSCGHTHSMAITLTRHVLAWGSNKSLQLGLGDGAPNRVFVPTLIPGLKDVQSVSCGSEHTIALTTTGALYSWGQGEGGLLGHGNTDSLSSPKRIEALKNMEITSVVSGGLHTLALTKQGACYSWGRAEGGQLGLPFEELIHLSGNNELFLTTPKKVRGALEGQQVIQVACGDAHSLALNDKGQVYGWGYTNSGQLGLGITGDNFDPSAHSTLQVKEPVLIEKLSSMKIKEIFAGSTFSLFLNEKKELYGCGLNDYNQLGIEKSVTKINNNLDNYRHASFNRTTESPIPKLIDCFTCMPILNVACGENHSLALVFFDSYYMIFAWGMQRHGQLGIGDIQQPFSTPRPISFLQYVTSYSMACGAYHSLVVLGEASKGFRREALVDRLERKPQNKWSSISFNLESTYEAMIDQALLNLDSIIPSEEGKIDNPKAIKKAT